MKIVLSTVGRFHMFALARELERHGVLECIYSGFPWAVLAREQVSRDKVRTFPWVRPIQMISGRFPIKPSRQVMETIHHASLTTLDAYVRVTMPDCDVFVGHEGAGLWSGAAAQRRGAVYVCDRGCSHIGWKEALLEAEYERVGLKWPGKTRTYDREIEEYELADLIVVPSKFARDSFVDSGIDQAKLAVVPYGVNLDVFGPVQRDSDGVFDVLFVGALSVRKGAHDLLEAFEAFACSNKRLTIVGAIADDIRSALGSRLAAPNVRCLGVVPHGSLKQVMGSSDVLLLPSIEEGLALVQAEALACGCPIIATTNTGALDLITDGIEGFIVPIRSPQIIAERLQRLADDPNLQQSMSAAAFQKVREIGGWRQYGDAMLEVYRRLRLRGAHTTVPGEKVAVK